MDKDRALHCLDIYLSNVNDIIIKSGVRDPATMHLVANVAKETADALAAIIDSLD